jgi:hypothetical protein
LYNKRREALTNTRKGHRERERERDIDREREREREVRYLA